MALSQPPSRRPQKRPLTAGRLELVRASLTERELQLLGELGRLQVATTGQLARLMFGNANEETATRLARRHLQRLGRSRLVRRFADRSRDRRVGAPGHVHALTAAGLRLIGAEHGTGGGQRKAWRPSAPFLAHRLAISELYVQLAEQTRAGGATVREFWAEPDCWRRYTGTAGQRLTLKPDALVRLGTGDLELSWFVEMDLGTERPATIADKCRCYRSYELAGEEVRRHGVFPGVMFIVPNHRRARVIAAVIARQPTDARALFTVATQDKALAALTQPEPRP
jgi:Replication-relaxation